MAFIGAPAHAMKGWELMTWAESLARNPDCWVKQPQEGEIRRFEQIWSDANVNAWIIKWLDGSDTGYHDHGVSAAGIVVLEGAIVEERLTLVEPKPIYRAKGQAYHLAPSVIHRVRPNSPDDSVVTINCYSPPLLVQGIYQEAADGVLGRSLIAHDEELKAAIK